MIVLYTDVRSERLKSIPSQNVVESLDDQSGETLYMTPSPAQNSVLGC